MWWRGIKVEDMFRSLHKNLEKGTVVTLTQKLYADAQEIWDQYLQHPFVCEMADGSLPLEKYRYYMLQDYLYLRDYIKIFAISISKSNDFAQIQFLSDKMAATLQETFRVHVPYMKRVGITDEEIRQAIPHIENSSYTHYMIWEAQSGDILSGLVALLNCSWSYAYIAQHLVERFPNATQNAFYGDWFAGYICEEYQQTNQHLIGMVDEIGADLSEEQSCKLCEIFKKCSQYELNFWNMAYTMGA